MIKRALFVLLILFGFSIPAFGQTTSVSGTISDSAGQTLNNGTFVFQLIPPTGNSGPFYLAGTLMTSGQLTIKGTLSSGGAFAGVVVGSNASITPVGTTWSFTVCPQATSPCYTQNGITIAGASQSLTSTVIPPPIKVQAASDVIPTAYSDTEIVGASLGSLYWNSVSSTLRICSAFAGGVCSWTAAGGGGGGGTVTSVTGTANEIAVATGTTTPVLSIPSTFIAPGSIAATTGVSGTSGTFSALTSGDCVQASTGGLLVSASAACGSGGGSPAFSAITSGTNTTAAMVVNTGASLGVTGGTLTTSNLDNYILVDGTTYAKTSAGVQAAINALSGGNGTVILSAGTYVFSSTVTISHNGQNLICWGGHFACFISYTGGPGTALAVTASGSEIFHGEIGNLVFDANADSTTAKVAMKVTDASQYYIHDILVESWTGNTSIGIDVQGREETTYARLSLFADIPFQIDTNPDSTITFDTSTIEDFYGVPLSTQPCINIVPGARVTHWTMQGTNTCAKGISALQWIDTTAAGESKDIHIANFHHEQSQGTTSNYSFNIQRSNASAVDIYDIEFNNVESDGPTESGIFLQRTVNATIINSLLDGTSGVTVLNADSTNTNTQVIGTYFNSGGTYTNNSVPSGVVWNSMIFNTLGVSNGSGGQLNIICPTSGSCGTPTWTAGSSSGTPAVTASSPLSINTTTGNISLTAPVLVAGIVDGDVPVTITTGTTATLGAGTYQSGYTMNQEGTAGTGVTYTLPATVKGMQYCVANSGTTSVVNTGVLTVYPPASSYVILNGVVNTVGGGGTHGVASGGAAGDGACFIAIDATHWQVYVQSGTWTEN